MPAFINGAIKCFSNRFGPMVQTIFVFLIGVFIKQPPFIKFHPQWQNPCYYIISRRFCESLKQLTIAHGTLRYSLNFADILTFELCTLVPCDADILHHDFAHVDGRYSFSGYARNTTCHRRLHG